MIPKKEKMIPKMIPKKQNDTQNITNNRRFGRQRKHRSQAFDGSHQI